MKKIIFILKKSIISFQKKKNLSIIFFLFYSIIFFTNCANLPSLQDGKTLGKGNFEILTSLSASKMNEAFPKFLDNDNTNEILPNVACRVKYGLKDNIDIGANFDSSTNIGLNGKILFFGKDSDKFHSSLGVDFGINIFTLFYDKIQYYYSIPIYASYILNEKTVFFITPRFINNSRYIFSDKNKENTIGYEFNEDRIVFSYGFIFGKKKSYGVEISNNRNVLKPSNISIGYLIKF